MKQRYLIGAIVCSIALVVWFDAIVIFLLSGYIPGINITLAPSTMLASMVASTALVASLRYRSIVYQSCLELYDQLFSATNEDQLAEPAAGRTANLPRRRYHEL